MKEELALWSIKLCVNVNQLSLRYQYLLTCMSSSVAVTVSIVAPTGLFSLIVTVYLSIPNLGTWRSLMTLIAALTVTLFLPSEASITIYIKKWFKKRWKLQQCIIKNHKIIFLEIKKNKFLFSRNLFKVRHIFIFFS